MTQCGWLCHLKSAQVVRPRNHLGLSFARQRPGRLRYPARTIWGKDLRFFKRTWLPFLALLGIALAIILAIFQGIYTDNFSSDKDIIHIIGLAISVALGFTIVLFLLYYAIAKGIPFLVKRAMVWVAFKALDRAINNQTTTVEWTAIVPLEDDIGVGLALGSDNGVAPGHRFAVLNAANREKWGVLEASDVRESYCICSVFDRINPEFWAELERRMRSDPSPPRGVTIRRAIPEESLRDWLDVLLKTWRD